MSSQPSSSSLYLSSSSRDLICGTVSGVVSILICHPLDTIRVRLQTTSALKFTGVSDVINQTIEKEGIKGFYKGMSTPLAAQGIQKATMFFVYGATQRKLQHYRSQF